MSVISPELNYESGRSIHPSPLVVQIQPINNLSTFDLSNSAVYGPVSFLINSRVMSLSKSTLEWKIACASSTTFNWYQACMGTQISRITLTTQATNQVVFDLSNFDRFCSGVGPVCTSDDALKNSYSSLWSNSATAVPALATSAATGPDGPLSMFNASNAIVNPDGLNQQYSGGYTPRRLLYVSGTTSGTDELAVSLKLGDIPMSIFSLDKLMYFGGENLMLDVYFSPINKFAWKATNATEPVTGAAAIASTMTVSDLKLKVVCEQNQETVREIVSKVNSSGLQLNFAYPYCYKSYLTGTAHSINLNLSRGFGSTLLAAITVPFNPTESLATAQDHSVQTAFVYGNTACNYNTYMDNIPIMTNSNIDVFAGQTFFYNKDHLRNSIIKSAQQYGVDFAHIDSFCADALCEVDQTLESGMSLDLQHQWSLAVNYTSVGASLNYYVFLICQKKLVIGGAGCQVI